MWSQLPKVQSITPNIILLRLFPVNRYVEVQVNVSRTFKRMITSFQRKIHGLIGMGRAMNVRKRQRVAITVPIYLTNPGFVEPPSIRKRTTGTNLPEQHYLNKIKRLQKRNYNELLELSGHQQCERLHQVISDARCEKDNTHGTDIMTSRYFTL